MIEIEKNLIWIKEQNLRESKEIEHRKQRAFQVLQDVVQGLLQRDPGISKIILFGSLARKDHNLRVDFDIDLAIRCTPKRYYSLVSLVLDVPEFKVDLIDLDATSGLLHQRILEEGIILYEK
jgi:predicted nucleotidyltransferase